MVIFKLNQKMRELKFQYRFYDKEFIVNFSEGDIEVTGNVHEKSIDQKQIEFEE